MKIFIAHWHWAIPSRKKSKQGGLRIYFFENPPEIFHFFNLTPENSRQNKAQTLDIIHNIVLNSLGIPRPKTKTPGNSIFFFFVTLGNSGNPPSPLFGFFLE